MRETCASVYKVSVDKLFSFLIKDNPSNIVSISAWFLFLLTQIIKLMEGMGEVCERVKITWKEWLGQGRGWDQGECCRVECNQHKTLEKRHGIGNF